jgi:protein-S-isoprenylcysteine O-methyltransferase Ste14
MRIWRPVIRAFTATSVYGLLLFLPAWTLDWPRAWLLLALALGGMLVLRFWAFAGQEALLAERRKSPLAAGQPRLDKALVAAFLLVMPADIAFIPTDVFRLHLLGQPGPLLSALGLALAAAGWLLIALAFRANAFAVPIVRVQSERQHAVAVDGIYRLIRHPLYAGVILVLVGAALWLGSYAAVVASSVPVILLVIRIRVEETVLLRDLDGYASYAQRVTHRLVPGIW